MFATTVLGSRVIRYCPDWSMFFKSFITVVHVTVVTDE